MTGRRRPPRVPRVPAKPKGFEDVEELSNEEVERRVDVRGGGQPRAPIERPIRRPPPARRRERTVARDSLLLIGLVIVGLVAVAFLLPDGPLTSKASNPPGTDAAVASSLVTPSGAPATIAGPSPTVLVVVDPSLDVSPAPTEIPTAVPTPKPTPTPTLRPGETPHPTPRPTSTPKPTPTPGATAPISRLIVEVTAINLDGGTSAESAWTVSVTSAGTASPSSFPGSTNGTSVTLSAGLSYSVSASGPSGYTKSFSSDCTSGAGGLPVAGATETCSIIVNDVQPFVTVFVVVDGGSQTASDWTVTVTATDVRPSSTFPGNSGGTVVHFDANDTFSITLANPNDTDYLYDHSGTCSGSGLAVGATASCTWTLTYSPPPTDTPPPGPIAPLGFLPLLIPRRWRTIHRT